MYPIWNQFHDIWTNFNPASWIMFNKQGWRDQKAFIGWIAREDLAYIFIASGPAFASDTDSACAGNFCGRKGPSDKYT